jgi:hypothetical protein
MRFTALLLLTVFTAAVANAHTYEVGQVWSYQSRAGDDSSVVLINLIETDPKLGAIYHISVLHVHIPGVTNNSKAATDLPHLPVSKETLDKSVVALVGHREVLSGYREGYDLWRTAFDAGHAGIYTLSVADIVTLLEETLKKQKLSSR